MAVRPGVTELPVPATGLRPTVFLGLGGLAGATLRHLKRRLRERFGDLWPAGLPVFRLLALDTDRTGLRAGQPAEALDPSDFVALANALR